MAKIRHIAYRAAGHRGHGPVLRRSLRDGGSRNRPNGAIDLRRRLNITILPANGPGASGNIGIDHMGFTVADEAETQRMVEAAGGHESNAVNLGGAFYEKKFVGPEGIVVDVGHWVATAPIDAAAARHTPSDRNPHPACRHPSPESGEGLLALVSRLSSLSFSARSLL